MSAAKGMRLRRAHSYTGYFAFAIFSAGYVARSIRQKNCRGKEEGWVFASPSRRSPWPMQRIS